MTRVGPAKQRRSQRRRRRRRQAERKTMDERRERSRRAHPILNRIRSLTQIVQEALAVPAQRLENSHYGYGICHNHQFRCVL